jgi:hypothetical protein
MSNRLSTGAELTKAGADLTTCHLLEAEMTILGTEVTWIPLDLASTVELR